MHKVFLFPVYFTPVVNVTLDVSIMLLWIRMQYLLFYKLCFVIFFQN